MRGTHTNASNATSSNGIIPAYAGNTSSRRKRRYGTRDHPRVCGEHGGIPCSLVATEGSSPRMRGTPVHVNNLAINGGIIPAYAGNTALRQHLRAGRRDHPRVCGEHPIFDHWPVRVTGSSPRMRGTPSLSKICSTKIGIIPAYAGNTSIASRLGIQTWDHPRVCGEHSSSPSRSRKPAGSSPRMRGTPPLCSLLRVSAGIIPAYAGNTCFTSAVF